MLAIQSDLVFVEKFLQDPSFPNTEVACLNGPNSIVVCGPTDEIQCLGVLFANRGIRTKVLATQYAFHSSQLDIFLDDFETVAQRVHFAKPAIPVASTMLGDVVTAGDVFNARYLRQQCRKPVRFHAAIAALRSGSMTDEKTVWIELGANPTCLNMIRSIHPETRLALPSLRKDQDDWQTMSSSVASAYNAGLEIDWSEFQRPFEPSLQMVQLPNYSFDLKNYWIDNGTDINTNRTSTPFQAPDTKAAFAPTSGLQRIEKQEIDSEFIRVTFASDASRPDLAKILRGHVVNGVALCPSSVYCEMALAAASHVWRISNPKLTPTIDVRDMEVVKPLIITSEDTKQTIFVDATLKQHENKVHFQFSTQSAMHHQIHATCVAQFGDAQEWVSEWSRNSHLVQSRAGQLREASSEGNAHRLLSPMVYKLFGAFVDYDTAYQGLQEVHLDSNLLEATASVKFRAEKGNFVCNPYWIDSIAHLSGFILNGTDWTPSDSVFISHGWKSFKIMSSLSSERVYRSYVRMQQSTRRGIFTGDIYLFDGAEVVAVCQDLRFQQIKRNVLDHLLPRDRIVSASGDLHEVHCKSQSDSARSFSQGPAAQTTSSQLSEDGDACDSFSVMMGIIAEQLGLDRHELDEDADLIELGVDSLMSSSILATLRDRMGAYLPATLFAECRSLNDLRSHFDTSIHPGSVAPVLQGSSKPQEVAQENSIGRNNALNVSKFDLPRALDIIAREVGIDISELEDDVCFSDLGIDSLLTISIMASLNLHFGEELPASLFVQYTTVSDLSLYLQVRFGLQQASSDESDNSDIQSKTDDDDDEDAGHITPLTEFSDYGEDEPGTTSSSLTETMRNIIAVGTGVVSEDVKDEMSLVELGLDSFMAMTSLMRFRDQTGLVLTSTFFIDNPNFLCVRRALDRFSGHAVCTGSPLCVSQPTDTRKAMHTSTNQHQASSILLQGSSLCKEPCLFLIPDGSGSPSSYVGLPSLNHPGAIYGLSSPFLADPAQFQMPLQDLVGLYVAEMRRIQPTGPYHIGGWSIGGVCAFEAASQLTRIQGEEVASLILIDAPCPTLLPPVPIEDIEFLQSVGALDSLKAGSKFESGTQHTPARLGLRDGVREHFAGSINALRQYHASAIDPSHAPKSVIILWAGHGVWQTLGAEMKVFSGGSKKPQHPTTSWLMDNRPSYETCGWEALLPGSEFTCHAIEGDHFSIMQKPGVVEMGAIIRSSLVHT